MTTDRPKGGRRPEDFPEVRTRDARVLAWLQETGGMTRNDLAHVGHWEPRIVTYALHRLKALGKVQHVAKGNEGHGYWAPTEEET